MNDVSLLVDGTIYTGWEQVSFSRSLDYLCGTFSMSIPSSYPKPPAINNGAACQLLIGGHVLFTGYIFGISDVLSTSGHSVIYTGRDKTADLVDCTHEGIYELTGKTRAVDVAKIICNPFGVDVVEGLDPAEELRELVVFRFDFGIVCSELIAKLCRHFAMLPYTNTNGELVLSKAGWEGNADDRLVTSENVEECEQKNDDSNRFSEVNYRYFVHGWQDERRQKRIDQLATEAKVSDKYTIRYRPLTVYAAYKGPQLPLQTFAEWEHRSRLGKSRTISCTLGSWVQSTGKPWTLNTIARLDSPRQYVDNAELLITGVSGSLSVDGGTSLTLTLMPPAAYDLGIPSRDDFVSKYDYILMSAELQREAAVRNLKLSGGEG